MTKTRLSRIDVIGGGPGGAFAARLLKLAKPSADVTLYDTLPPENTFGFGVGLSVTTQRSLSRSDPETFRLIGNAAHSGHGMEMHSRGGFERIAGNDSLAIARATLLQILYRQAEQAGVKIVVGARVDAFECDADLVVAADGVNSATRTSAADAFGVRETVGRQKYIWCGADTALPNALFAPAESDFGTLTTHAYPYTPDLSTFLVETDESTWSAAGFDRDLSHLAHGESDETACDFLESVFKKHLGGARLLRNNSRWTQFRTIQCSRWHHGNVALLGDAAHTAHYSVGSGTKLAMEDAIALASSLDGDSVDLDQALSSYRSARQPGVAQLQYVAHRSELWWGSYVERMRALTPAQTVLSFFSRAGNVSLETLREREPEVVNRALVDYGGEVPGREDLIAWTFDQQFIHGVTTLRSRRTEELDVALVSLECDIEDPGSPEAAQFVTTATESAIRQGAQGVELCGPPDARALRRRLDIVEQIKFRSDMLTAVRAPQALRAELAAALIAGRTDLVSQD